MKSSEQIDRALAAMKPDRIERGLFKFDLVEPACEANGRTWRLRLCSVHEAAQKNRRIFFRKIYFQNSTQFTKNLETELEVSE